MVEVSSRQETLPPLTRAARTVSLAAAETTSVGLALWLMSSRDELPRYQHEADLAARTGRLALIDVSVALMAGAVFATALLLWKRRSAPVILERLARRLSPLCIVWLAPFVFNRSLWEGQDLLVLPVVAAGGWGLVAALRTSWITTPSFPRLAGLRAEWGARVRACWASTGAALARIVTPPVVVTLGAIAYAVYFSAFTITLHRNLVTRSFDVGLEDNLMWHVVHGGLPLFRSTPFAAVGSHFGNHATWFSYVLAPIYAVLPRVETLLVIQASLMGAAAIQLYFYASRHLPAWTAALVACAYLVYPPLHGANLYEFHYLPLGVFFIWLALYAVDAKRSVLAVVAVVLAVSVREDVAACLGVMGLFLLITGAAPRAGSLIAVIGGGYFVLMKLFVMPAFAQGESFSDMFIGLIPKEDPESGFGGVLKTAIGNPAFTANVLCERDKVVYLLELFAPVMLLPLTRPIAFLLVLPGVLFTLLSTGYRPLYQPTFQYTSYWTVFIFIGVVYALEQTSKPRHAGDAAGRLRQRTLAFGLAAASLAATYLNGGILHRENVRAGFDHVSFKTTQADLDNRVTLAELAREIPPGDKVVASARLLPHVSSRAFCYTLNQGVQDADWLLFESVFESNERSLVREALTGLTFGVVDVRGTMALAKRGAATDRNADVLEHVVH